jgi:hypothetical protein
LSNYFSDTDVARSGSIKPNIGILIEKPQAGKAGQKNLTKSEFDEFTSIEKCAQQF